MQQKCFLLFTFLIGIKYSVLISVTVLIGRHLVHTTLIHNLYEY